MLPRLKLIKVWTFLLVNIQQTVTQYLIAPHMTSTLTPKGYSPFLLSPPDMVFKAHWLLNVKLCNLFIQIFFFLFCSRCFFFWAHCPQCYGHIASWFPKLQGGPRVITCVHYAHQNNHTYTQVICVLCTQVCEKK